MMNEDAAQKSDSGEKFNGTSQRRKRPKKNPVGFFSEVPVLPEKPYAKTTKGVENISEGALCSEHYTIFMRLKRSESILNGLRS